MNSDTDIKILLVSCPFLCNFSTSVLKRHQTN